MVLSGFYMGITEVYRLDILAGCSISESMGFSGRLTLPGEGKSTNKVYLNVEVRESSLEGFESLSDNVRCISFYNDFRVSVCPAGWEGNVFNIYSIEEALDGGINPVEGVIDLVELPNGYCDMRTLAGLCTRYPSVRVVGGNLLAVEGVRIGRYERGKERMSPVFDCVYDTFVETSLNDLSGIEEKVRKAKSSISSLEKKGGKKKSNDAPKVSKRVKAFSDMFGEDEVEF